MGLIGQAIHEKFKVASAHFEKGNDQTGAFMCFAIIEELVRALGFLDDSNTEISSVIGISFDVFKKLRYKKISEKLRTEIFEYCVDAFIRKKMQVGIGTSKYYKLAMMHHC